MLIIYSQHDLCSWPSIPHSPIYTNKSLGGPCVRCCYKMATTVWLSQDGHYKMAMSTAEAGPATAPHSEASGSHGTVRGGGGRLLLGRIIGGHWAGRGGQLGAIRPTGEWLGISQADRGAVRGPSGWQVEAVRGNQAGRPAVRIQWSWIVRGMSNCPTGIGLKLAVGHPLKGPRLERVQTGLRDHPLPCTNFVHWASSCLIKIRAWWIRTRNRINRNRWVVRVSREKTNKHFKKPNIRKQEK
uniref:Uncharacterized protein n=1 Tax=Pipistrellus kuhlii TaxID=59472 RepID=A0A7J8B2L5_PIPKU|nr:hypothetical protein mPipKuh1_007894 [Pipistrellus kuhlii]